ncbi:MAG TPA: hypothetical protein VJ818_07780 [Actinomycetota bacterium]|nr:hypothetical protein [Actinomycetota bacterium]
MRSRRHETNQIRLHDARVLGTKAVWGSVGYSGEAFAPAPETYKLIDVVELRYTTVQDSGVMPSGRALANLYPLIAAALYEVGFALEAGPLTTWSN